MTSRELFPEIEPFKLSSLKVSDLHTVVFEEVGRPDGIPVVFLHGGPGVGILPGYRRFFDPSFYRVILLNQRGSGKSTPLAEIRQNTTWDLVEDLEKVRLHCKIDRWIVFGGSWGSTLALAYAQTYPQSVAGMIVRGVFLGRPAEIDWLHRFGASEIWPDVWERFSRYIPDAEKNDLVAAYYRRLTSEDSEIQRSAARNWAMWESSTMCLVQDHAAIVEMTDSASALSIGRIECHFTYNKFFLKSPDQLLENCSLIQDIPCRIVQGRYDIICPVRSAWDLHKALPKSELRIVDKGAHSPMESAMANELVRATEDFKTLSQK